MWRHWRVWRTCDAFVAAFIARMTKFDAKFRKCIRQGHLAPGRHVSCYGAGTNAHATTAHSQFGGCLKTVVSAVVVVKMRVFFLLIRYMLYCLQHRMNWCMWKRTYILCDDFEINSRCSCGLIHSQYGRHEGGGGGRGDCCPPSTGTRKWWCYMLLLCKIPQYFSVAPSALT